MRRKEYKPEGRGPLFPKDAGIDRICESIQNGDIWEGTVICCDSDRNLHLRWEGYDAVIPREEGVHPIISGAERDISLLSRVGKRTSFTIISVLETDRGHPKLLLSRKKAQEQVIRWLLEDVRIGQVLPARVTHLAAFGAFVDLGCGVISMIPLEYLSWCRVSHPRERLAKGQDIFVCVKEIDRVRSRLTLTHKELLGTWEENAEGIEPGDAVMGIVRAVRDYGVFVELTANLCGLAEPTEDVEPGDLVSVSVRSLYPEQHRIKLQIIERIDKQESAPPLRYFIMGGTIENWTY